MQTRFAIVPSPAIGYHFHMLFTLNLSHPITYRPQEHHAGEIFTLEKGSEFTFCCRYRYEDVFLTLEKKWCGFRSPYTQKEKEMVEDGLTPPPRDGYTLSIPEGKYSLLQIPAPEDEKEILRQARTLPVSKSEGDLYIRFFKENDFESVMQIFLPL